MIDLLNGRSAPEWSTVMATYDARRLLDYDAATRLLSKSLAELLPGEKLRHWSRNEIQKSAFHFSNLGQGVLGSVRRAELNERFSLDHQRASAMARQAEREESELDALNEEDTDAEDGTQHTVFDPAPDKSFLPHMIQLSKQHGFLLHFHRIKPRPDTAEDTRTPAELAVYLAAMQRYMNQEGCAFTDECTEPAITAEMYADDAHIKTTPEIQRPYMQHFWRCVQPTLAPVLQSQRVGQK
jgi:hypothetical protein